MYSKKNTYFQYFWHSYPLHKLIFALKSSLSFLTFCLLALSVTKSGVYGVLIVVVIAIIFFTIKFIVKSSALILFLLKALVTWDYSEFPSLSSIISLVVSMCFKHVVFFNNLCFLLQVKLSSFKTKEEENENLNTQKCRGSFVTCELKSSIAPFLWIKHCNTGNWIGLWKPVLFVFVVSTRVKKKKKKTRISKITKELF